MMMKLSALFIYVAIGIVVVLPASSFAQKPSTVPTKLSPFKTQVAKIKAHSVLDGITGLADNSQVTLLEMVFQPVLRKCDNELCKRSPQYRIINILEHFQELCCFT